MDKSLFVKRVERTKEIKRVSEVSRVPTLKPGRSYSLVSPQYDFSEEDEDEKELE